MSWTENKKRIVGIGAVGVLWVLCALDWRGTMWLPQVLQWPIFGAAAGCTLFATWRSRARRDRRFWLVATVSYLCAWQFFVFAADVFVWDELRGVLSRVGLGALFLIGLCWTTWILESASQYALAQRRDPQSLDKICSPSWDPPRPAVRPTTTRIWNPGDPNAWYYGRRRNKLNQSLAGFISYSLLFVLVCMMISQFQGCYEIYEIPAGGGEAKAVAQVVKVQKVIRQKFVVNPFSSILFQVPPIDEIKLQLEEITEHAYTPGYGQGTGAGFAGGTNRGKVRFIRLEYSGGDWDQDYGVGGDLNMLIKYYELTTHKIAKRTESRRIAQLTNFPRGKSPPVVYLTGQRNISLSNNEIKVLREYLLDKHGMLFGDNGGSRHFHNQFLSMMNRVLPDVRPVPVPLDDIIHRVPFPIPFLPYVAPHGGKQALGWYQDGRWLCYYHPGDIGDAWSDGHAGVSAEITDACYHLGANVLFYAHMEYAKWLTAQDADK